MKYLFALLMFPTLAFADCDHLGIYAFFMGGCPQYGLNVDVTRPICEQPEFKQYSYLDPRCYVEVPQDTRCTYWDCPAPYDKVYKEPISGRVAVVHGSWQLVDWHYRAARNAYGALQRELNKKRKR